MNPKVEQWLQAQKKNLSASKRAEREKHLVEIGLIDENKCHYTDFFGNTITKKQYDGFIESGGLAYEKKVAIDVTDEEYAEICKYAPEKNMLDEVDARAEKNMVNEVDVRAERVIMKFAHAVKIIGVILWIILALIGLIVGLVVADSTWDFSVGLFMASFLGGAFSGFVCWLVCYLAWAVLKVFTNISNTLYRIEEKIPY